MLVCESDTPEYLQHVKKVARENKIAIREIFILGRRCTEVHVDNEADYYALSKLLGIIKE